MEENFKKFLQLLADLIEARKIVGGCCMCWVCGPLIAGDAENYSSDGDEEHHLAAALHVEFGEEAVEFAARLQTAIDAVEDSSELDFAETVTAMYNTRDYARRSDSARCMWLRDWADCGAYRSPEC